MGLQASRPTRLLRFVAFFFFSFLIFLSLHSCFGRALHVVSQLRILGRVEPLDYAMANFRGYWSTSDLRSHPRVVSLESDTSVICHVFICFV